MHHESLPAEKAAKITLSNLARQLWAKSEPNPKSLWHHMLDAGLCARQLVNERRFAGAVLRTAELFDVSVEEAQRLIIYLAANHDGYGKASPAFQRKDEALSRPFHDEKMISKLDMAHGFRHERYGEQCYRKQAANFQIASVPAHIFASTIAYHHQGKIGEGKKPKLQADKWLTLGDELHAAIITVFDPPLDKLQSCSHCGAAVMALLPMVILSDWMASSSPFAQLDESLSDEAYCAASEALAHDVVRQDGLVSDQSFPTITSYHQLWPSFSEATLRPVQRAMLTQADPGAGLTIIEAPMGEGKTEAGAFQAARLCSLWGKQGIYFALPTAATSNQMFGRMNEMLATLHLGDARLMHGMAWLFRDNTMEVPKNEDHDDRQAAYDWLRPLRRAMLAESAVGTVDQAMMAAMPVKYGCLRLLGLMGKVLVVDEIHAYDAYMSEIIERLLSWCSVLRIPVILLSATLTMEKRKKLVQAYGGEVEHINPAYPLVTQVRQSKDVLQIPVDGCAKRGAYQFWQLPIWQDHHALAQYAVSKIAQGGCLCVMMNTVAEAQAAWQAIREAASSDTMLMLFHARFKAAQRDDIEKRCVRLFGKDGCERPAKAILVCTQVVEQSLDLDFDAMITQIAPMDLLLQRAGRVHRHERGQRPSGMEEAVVEVLVPQGENYGASEAIYAPWLLTRTSKLLPRTVQIPQDVRAVIEEVYKTPGDIPEAWARLMFSEQQMKALAGGNMLPKPDARTFFGWEMNGERFSMEEPEEGMAASTRLDACSMRIALLPKETIQRIKDDQDVLLDHEVAKLAFQKSFTIREKPPQQGECAQITEGSGLCRAVWFVAEESLPVQIGRTRLSYDETLGAITERMRG